MSNANRVPLSIESLLQKQKEEKEAASKPKFLTREERAAIAIERRKQEIQQEKEKAERVKAQRAALDGNGSGAGAGAGGGGGDNDVQMHGDGYHHARERERERERDVEEFRSGNRAREREAREGDPRNPRYDDRRKEPPRREDDRNRPIPTGPRADRSRGGAAPQFSRGNDMPPPPVPSRAGERAPSESTFSTTTTTTTNTTGSGTSGGTGEDGTGMSSTELAAIRSRYLGVDKKKRPIRKMTDKKFVFDWAEQDDTFAMDSPSAVGSQRQGAAVMFGRGHLAGMENSIVPQYPLPSSVSAAKAGEGPLAKKKGAVADERHWSEKPLEEMKDRDWRIFREDYSISARGGNIPQPLRSWSESIIPAPILDVIDKIGYKDPSPIQRQAIPIGLQNRDLIGIAETGSGKTAA
ncbi:mRNA splicing protein prp28, partial [Serendipita sp. 401]